MEEWKEMILNILSYRVIYSVFTLLDGGVRRGDFEESELSRDVSYSVFTYLSLTFRNM